MPETPSRRPRQPVTPQAPLPTGWIGVFGTGSDATDAADWSNPASAFARFLRPHGLTPVRERAFSWSGGLSGVPFLDPVFGRDWEAAADAFAYYCAPLAYDARNVIAHSHGGQAVLLAAANGVRLRNVILIGTPVRRRIERDVAPRAVRQIARTLHVTAARWDGWGLAGALFDGRLTLRRTFRVPGIVSEQVRGIGHGGVLRDPALFPLWESHGWIEFLKASAGPHVETDVNGAVIDGP